MTPGWGVPAEMSEGSLGGDAFGVVASGDEEDGGGVDADAVEREEARVRWLNEAGEVAVEERILGVDVDDVRAEGGSASLVAA